MLVPIKFSRLHAPYNAGEVAAFSRKVADLYVDRGLATYFVKDIKPAQPAVTVAAAEPEAEKTAAPTKPKRKRGRPRKISPKKEG